MPFVQRNRFLNNVIVNVLKYCYDVIHSGLMFVEAHTTVIQCLVQTFFFFFVIKSPSIYHLPDFPKTRLLFFFERLVDNRWDRRDFSLGMLTHASSGIRKNLNGSVFGVVAERDTHAVASIVAVRTRVCVCSRQESNKVQVTFDTNCPCCFKIRYLKKVISQKWLLRET